MFTTVHRPAYRGSVDISADAIKDGGKLFIHSKNVRIQTADLEDLQNYVLMSESYHSEEVTPGHHTVKLFDREVSLEIPKINEGDLERSWRKMLQKWKEQNLISGYSIMAEDSGFIGYIDVSGPPTVYSGNKDNTHSLCSISGCLHRDFSGISEIPEQ
ncbi:hypothetical protein [uncultured Endozoicomonas sp.]|uniref:hypothetical protein n=1 Tax=uncultured Endozoicomonas sp. TaxID=432652 RepID=UPI002632B552|nr:hypothetical protein [uncultured Endozoicomonas sp.]